MRHKSFIVESTPDLETLFTKGSSSHGVEHDAPSPVMYLRAPTLALEIVYSC